MSLMLNILLCILILFLGIIIYKTEKLIDDIEKTMSEIHDIGNRLLKLLEEEEE